LKSILSNSRFVLVLLHLCLGIFLIFGVVSKILGFTILFFGIVSILKNKNKNNEAIYWAAYMVGSEVLFRMSGGTVLYELPKYTVLLFLFLGLYVEKYRHHVSVSYIIYILLLLIGIAFIDIPFTASIRRAIAFNLSGPVLLGISAIYFYRRKLSLTEVLDLLFVMVLPILAMLSLLYFKTPDIKELVFSSNANYTTSGGYGPNQVSTILGLGVFIFLAHLMLQKRIFWLLGLDIFFFMYLIYRGLLTFSRGGMLTALAAILVFSVFYLLAVRDKITNLIKYATLVGFFGIVLVGYTSYKTDGMLINRYTNKNTAGIERKDFSTGRIDLFKSELENFYEHPFFGIGVGGSKYDRLEEEGIVAASHNEVSRLLSEHGLIGLLVLILLLFIPSRHLLSQPYLARAFLGSFLVFWFLTVSHSAMRIAFPAFIYGLSVMTITFKEEEESLPNE
jgi:O-antigen ligase